MIGLVRPTQSLVRARTGAAPANWSPWTEAERMRQEMDDLVTRFFGYTPLPQILEGAQGANLPVELYETGDTYHLRAYLPGMSREDINLEVTGERIRLWGEHRTQAPAEDAKVLWNSTNRGSFKFEFVLPAEIRTEDVQASYRDGVLEVQLRKLEPAKPEVVRVPIQG